VVADFGFLLGIWQKSYMTSSCLYRHGSKKIKAESKTAKTVTANTQASNAPQETQL